jgi:hypothetical protein
MAITSQEKEVHRGNRALTLCITLWSDEFEPNNCKDNRVIVWVMTVDIATPTNNHHTTYITYVLGVGTKCADHQPVYDLVMSDLENLATDDQLNLYYSKVGGKVRVSC